MSRRPESERSDWTDLDLLTRDEAAERLEEEIADIESKLGDAGAAEREVLEVRLHALRDAVAELAGS
ncbi:hypothetical protein ACWEVP_03435 [Amycolatopsis sp. NPDC003865]